MLTQSQLSMKTLKPTNFGFVDIPVGLDEVNFIGTKADTKFMPIAAENKPQNLAVVERNGNKLELAQTGSKFMPIAAENKPQNLAVVERNGNKLELAQTGSKFMPIAAENKPQNLAVVERNGNKLELAQTKSIPVDSSVVQKTAPGDFNIVDQEAVDSTLVQTGKITQKSATGLN